MKIHKEGYSILLIATLIWTIVIVLLFLYTPAWLAYIISGIAVVAISFTTYFFRSPRRELFNDPAAIFAACDGEVVVIEEVKENEYFKDKRIQVSVFMSIWNVHINWFPVKGEIKFFRHHNGKYRVAWHPKSSEDNERTTIVIESEKGEILMRQIAGFVARRIVSYATPGKQIEQNLQCGFIKFGSRVDVFLPPDAVINVRLGQKVVGTQTVLAYFNQEK